MLIPFNLEIPHRPTGDDLLCPLQVEVATLSVEKSEGYEQDMWPN